jgi:RNA polymerase sigma factor (TIGR02999 family)
VTTLLGDAARGDERAVDELLPLVYDELRALAGRYMRDERSDHTLQTTALVHEAYLRLVGSDQVAWESRGHFFRVAAQAMRRILVDHARHHRSAKHGGKRRRISLNAVTPVRGEGPNLDVLALDEALLKLSAIDRQKTRIVELRFFAGLTAEETAGALGISLSSVERGWALARAWLYRELTSA